MKTPQKRTTIYDIAKRLNIAASSISRALTNSSKVNSATKALILKTAAEMNYQQNVMASNLRKEMDVSDLDAEHKVMSIKPKLIVRKSTQRA